MATGLGVFLAIAPQSTLIVLGAFVLITKITSMVALGSICAAALLPVLMYFEIPRSYHLFEITAAALTALVIIKRHEENIKRMLKGEELSYRKED